MAQLDAVIDAKVQVALRVLSRLAPMAGAYLFGSWAEGKPDRWSDIDLAVFIDGLEAYDLHQRARLSAQVQKEAGDDVELHLLPANALRNPAPASFAAWVLAHGVEVRGWRRGGKEATNELDAGSCPER